MSDVATWPAARVITSHGQLSDQVADYVRELIVSGQIRPDTRVRPEPLAEALGVSTTPAREALQALRVEGFLRLEPRRGFAVAPLTDQDISDVYAAQSLLAGELAARASDNAGAGDIQQLETIQAELRAASERDDVDQVERLNHNFHRHINLLAGAPKIASAVGLLSKYAPRRFYASIPGWPAATLEDHNALLMALNAGDAEAARRAMAVHIAHAGDLLADHFRKRVVASSAE